MYLCIEAWYDPLKPMDDIKQKIEKASEISSEVLALIEHRDIVVKTCAEEMIQFGCDMLCAIGREYTAENILAVFVAVGMCGKYRVEEWQHYTKELAPMVVAHIRSTGGKVPLDTDDGTIH
jgi:hypothetical protein